MIGRMKSNFNSSYFLLLVFFAVNAVQSWLTPVSKDEAYYWMFSRDLAWGYFDHPPMIALLIRVGTFFLGGTAGIRIITNILISLTLFLVWKLLPESDRVKKSALPVFFLVAFSMPVFNIYGFIATPDAPLLFLSALYLYVFNRFVRSITVTNALVLGLVAALLMYSKYHGAFLILFCLMPYYRLIGNRYFILAAAVGIVLYLPHILWQYDHDFVSFRYHLFQRSDGFMGGKNMLNYALNAFLILNPFLFGYYILHLRKIHPDLPLSKEMSFVLWGFLLFFGIASVRDHIEPQWIGMAAIPLTVILVHYILNRENHPGPFRKFGVVSLVLIVILRVGLTVPMPINTEFHRRGETYYKSIQQHAQDRKVFFINSYYDAAKYTYYTGDSSFSYNSFDYRRNQYDIWDYEDAYHLKKAMLLTGYPYPWTGPFFRVENKVHYYYYSDAFPMINKVEGEIECIDRTFSKSGIQPISFTVFNPYTHPLHFDDAETPLRFMLVFQVGLKRFLVPVGTGIQGSLGPGAEMEVRGYFYPDIPAGDYRVAVGLMPGLMNPILVTEKMKITVN